MQLKIADLHLTVRPNTIAERLKFLDHFLCAFNGQADLTVELCPISQVERACGGCVKLDEVNVWTQFEDRSWSVSYEGRRGEGGELLMRCDASADWSSGSVYFLENSDFAKAVVEGFLGPILLKNRIIYYNGLMLHASAILHQGEAILFSAPSGTGKSTQADLWVKHKGSQVINDDSPVVRVTENGVRAYGSPWCGSRGLFQNVDAPVSAIVIVEQAARNSMEPLAVKDAVLHVLPRFLLPYHDSVLMTKALSVAEMIVKQVPVYKLYCTPDQDAVIAAAQCLDQ